LRERERAILEILDDYKLGTREEKRREEKRCHACLLRITLWWVFSWYHVFFNAKIFSCLSFSLKDWIRERWYESTYYSRVLMNYSSSCVAGIVMPFHGVIIWCGLLCK
jgi:hypothetical protein